MIQLIVKRHNQEPKTYEYERLMYASNHRKIEHQTLDTLICTEIWLDGDLISVAGWLFTLTSFDPVKTIVFELRNNFGIVRAYPKDYEACLLCDLTNTKTLLPQSIITMHNLGFIPVDPTGKEIYPSQLN